MTKEINMKCSICNEYLPDVDANSSTGLSHLCKCQSEYIVGLQAKYDILYQWHLDIQCGKRAEDNFSQRLLKEREETIHKLEVIIGKQVDEKELLQGALHFACQDIKKYANMNAPQQYDSWYDKYISRAKENK